MLTKLDAFGCCKRFWLDVWKWFLGCRWLYTNFPFAVALLLNRRFMGPCVMVEYNLYAFFL